MNLAKYADQVAEWSYHNDDDLLGYLDEWEARQPPPITKSKQRLRSVQNTDELREATKVAEQETLPEEMPELFQPEQEAPNTLSLQILDEMVEEHQRRNYTLRPAKSTSQLRYYEMWRAVFVRKGFVPVFIVDLSNTVREGLMFLFPEARKVSEFAVIFGFGDCLPKIHRPTPEREAELCYHGFFARCDLEAVRADHDQVLEDVRVAAEVRKREEAVKAELKRQRDAEIARRNLEEWRQWRLQQEQAKQRAEQARRDAEMRQRAEQARRDAEARQRAEQARRQAERQRQARAQARTQTRTQTEYWRVDVEYAPRPEPATKTCHKQAKVATGLIQRILRRCEKLLDDILG